MRVRRNLKCLVLVVMCMLPISAVRGQADSGMRVRVTRTGADRPLVGTLLSADADSVRLRSALNRQLVVLPTASVLRLERSVGRRSQAGHGAMVGGIAGATTGLLLGLVASSEDDSWVEIGADGVAAATVFFAAAGAGLGALLGAASRKDLWQQIPVPGRSQSNALRAWRPVLRVTMQF